MASLEEARVLAVLFVLFNSGPLGISLTEDAPITPESVFIPFLVWHHFFTLVALYFKVFKLICHASVNHSI